MGCQAKYRVMHERFIRPWDWCGTAVRLRLRLGDNQGQGRMTGGLLEEYEAHALVTEVTLC